MNRCNGECGYTGNAVRMAFDVNPAYNYLCSNGQVVTVRPSFQGSHGGLPRKAYPTPIHVHRASKWDGRTGTKTEIERGSGADNLLQMMEKYFKESGFPNSLAWYLELLRMHSYKSTTKEWIFFRAVVHQK